MRLDVHSDRAETTPPPKYLPVGALDDTKRVWRHSAVTGLEGFPLLHIEPHPSNPRAPDWPEWVEKFGYERTAPERGVHYAHMRDALEGVRSNAGLLVCGLSFVLDEVASGRLCLPFPAHKYLPATSAYRLALREAAGTRPQVRRFRDWLVAKSETTRLQLDELTAA